MRRLTLSFDNGPWPGVTEQVLDTLAERSILASFFLVGERLHASGSRALVERAKQAGHWICNHTMTHSVPLGRRGDPDHAETEIAAMQTLLGDLAHPDLLFRPNAGKGILGPHVLSQSAVDHLVANRHTLVLWNSVPRDWEQPPDAWVARALDDIARQDWTLLVLHDKPGGAMDFLPAFLDRVLADGVEIVQAFPPDCTPIVRGAVQRPLDELTTPRA